MRPIVLVIFFSFLCVASYGQTQYNYRRGLTGNYIIQFIQDPKDKDFFSDPVDDTLDFIKVVDNIYKDKNDKIYILTSCFYPKSDDTLLNLEYFKDVSNFIDLKSYKQIKHGCFISKGKVYTWWVNSDGEYPVEFVGADPETFIPFDSILGGIDKQHVFYGGIPDDFQIIKDADPKTIRVLRLKRCCGSYFVDDKNVFYGLYKIEGADPKTFKMLNLETIDAEDKNGKYFEGELIR